MNFFILGLPRSRTAWLANFLTYDGLFCYHEASNGCKTVEEYKDKLKDCGDANTGMAFFKIEEMFPDSKFIVIDSDPQNTIDYARNTYGITDIKPFLELKERLDKIEGLHIPFDEINSRLEEIWSYVSTVPFDRKRAKLLVNMNIQIQDPSNIDALSLLEFADACHAL